MTDFFVLVGVPRRPVVDEGVLQEAYLRRAAALHPDANGGDAEKFRELVEARRTLLDPAARVRHLLALAGRPAGEGGSHGAPDLFLEVAGALEAAKKLGARMADARSAIGRAALEPERRGVEQRVLRVTQSVEAAWQNLCGRLHAEDARWPDADFAQLETLGKEFVFLSRWQSELRDALFGVRNARS